MSWKDPNPFNPPDTPIPPLNPYDYDEDDEE